MNIKCLPTGMYDSNSYIVSQNGEGVIIDAGVRAREIEAEIQKEGLNIKYIFLTHGHIDHIGHVDELREKTGARVLIHENDQAALTNQYANGSALFGEGRAFKAPDGLYQDGEKIKVGELEFEIIHTPGHTSGGVCIKVEKALFTGDTLFKMSIGRTDLGDGDYQEIIQSIKDKLLTLPEDTIVYPGHYDPSTIGFERKNNSHIR